MNHGHQFDEALSAERRAEQERKQAEREARKKLEAVAPDLLAACKSVCSRCRHLETILQAIAKAEENTK